MGAVDYLKNHDNYLIFNGFVGIQSSGLLGLGMGGILWTDSCLGPTC